MFGYILIGEKHIGSGDPLFLLGGGGIIFEICDDWNGPTPRLGGGPVSTCLHSGVQQNHRLVPYFGCFWLFLAFRASKMTKKCVDMC